MNVVALPATSARRVGNFSNGESRSDLSKQWIARPADQRFLSLDALRDSVQRRAERCSEARVETKKIEILTPEILTKDDLNRLTVGLPDGTTAAPTHWSFNQLCSLAKAPAGHYRTLASPIVRDALMYGLRYNRAADGVKFYAGDDQLLAATGLEYGRIFDHEVVEAVQQIAGNGTGDTRWKVPGVLDWRTMVYDPGHPITPDTTTLYASDRDVFIFLVDDLHPIEVGKLPNGEPDLMFRGFYVTNSEVGSSALKVAVFYLRAICCNRILWGVEGFEEVSMRHSKYAPSRFMEEIRPALESFAHRSDIKLIDAVQQAKAAKVAEDQDSAVDFLVARDFSRKRALEILEQHEREEHHPARSAWDFAQGITAMARSIENNDERVTVELKARQILDRVA